jgi:hypothetical protein
MKKALPLILLACTVTAAAPASAASNGGASCVAGFASAGRGAPPFVVDLMTGIGRLFGYWVRYDCDIPED